MARENRFQSELINKIKELFPGCLVMKNDSGYIQGIPDLTILHKDRWAVLECKKNKDADHQPNQTYYVDKLNGMSYASFVYPENKEQVLDELQQTFGSRGSTRVSGTK